MAQQVTQDFFATIGRLIAVGGGGAAVAYALFRWLGTSWLDQQFQKQLAQLRHDQQKELEQLRHQISSEFSRISKIHEKEFEVLPEAWSLLNQAHGSIFQVVKVYRESPDFNQMSEAQLNEFVGASRLPEHRKQGLLRADDRNRYYQEAIFWIELSDAETAHMKLSNYLVVNSIFMTQLLRLKFRAISEALRTALIEHRIGRQSRSPDLLKSSTETMTKLSEMFDDIESEVQKRLRYEEA